MCRQNCVNVCLVGFVLCFRTSCLYRTVPSSRSAEPSKTPESYFWRGLELSRKPFSIALIHSSQPAPQTAWKTWGQYGGEQAPSSVLAPKVGPLGMSPKKVGDDIVKGTSQWISKLDLNMFCFVFSIIFTSDFLNMFYVGWNVFWLELRLPLGLILWTTTGARL